LTSTITCTELIGTNTHFYGGHTIPCEAPDCKACADGVSWRWHGYVSAYNPLTNRHFLFEMTAQAAQPLWEYFQAHGTLRGCTFEASRAQGRKNGRVFIRTKQEDLLKINLPSSPNMALALCHLWNLPASAVTDSGQQWNHRSIGIDAAITAEAQLPHKEPRHNGRAASRATV
jgi:hypothetical protein